MKEKIDYPIKKTIIKKRVTCPNCGEKNVGWNPSYLLGKHWDCHQCGHMFIPVHRWKKAFIVGEEITVKKILGW